MLKLCRVISVLMLELAFVDAQAPTGNMLGTITNESRAVIPSATAIITNKASGSARAIRANGEGLYREHYKLTILGEVFNAFAIQNLIGYSLSLRTQIRPAHRPFRSDLRFGWPTSVSSQYTLHFLKENGYLCIKAKLRERTAWYGP